MVLITLVQQVVGSSLSMGLRNGLMGLGALAIAVMLYFPRGLWGSFAESKDIHLFPIRRRLIVREGS